VSHKSVEKEQNEQSNKDKNENLQQLQDKITKLEDELDTTRIELQETQVKLKLMVDFQLFCSLHLKIYIYI
jgi:multidrug resistance efflux pump